MLTIKPVEEIINKLLSKSQLRRNFPKALNFPFDQLYSDITTQIKTTEISSECILLDSVEAFIETKEASDTDYWAENYTIDDIAKFWIFGRNGQGDLWLFDNESKVYFYDHNMEQMCKNNFVELNLNFEKWLQFADLNNQFDDIYETENEITEQQKAEYKEKLNEVSSILLTKYPFEI